MKNNLERDVTILSLLKFTFPSIVMMVIMSFYTIVDGTFVSRLVGTDAFSAVNIVYPLMSFTIGLGTMFGTGTAAIVSRKLGEGKRAEADQIFSFILIVTIGLGAAFSVICLLFLKPLIYMLGSNGEIYGYCRDYALPLILFFPANILQLQFQNLYVADGKPHIGLIVTILGGLSNVALDYLFIAVLGMGVAGAAVATGIGCAIPAVFGLVYFACNRRGNLRLVRPVKNLRALRNAAANGSSEMVNYLATSITTFLFNIIMMRMIGQDGVAAVSILLYFDFVLTAVGLGYSMGVAPLISYNYGYGNKEKLQKLFRSSVSFCALTGIAMTAVTILFGDSLALIFAREGTYVYELAAVGFGIYAYSYLFKTFNIFASAMFTAFGDGRTSAALSFLRTLVFMVLCLIGLPALFGVMGVWYATPLAEALALCLAIFFTVKYGKKYHYMKLDNRKK